MRNKNLIAIIGDLIDSKSIKNRHMAQEELKYVLNQVNKKYKEYIVSKWTITLGDEFQVLLIPNVDIFKMLDYISYKMGSIKIRFGIGLGEIYTSIHYEKSIGADGPAYWHAREAIKSVHRNNNYGNNKIYFVSENQSDIMINNLLHYTDWMKENWIDSQSIILDTLIDNDIYDEKFEQRILAEKLDISDSAASRRVKSSGIRLYLSSRNSIAQELIR